MSAQVLIDAFRLPAQALVAQRVAKKMLAEQGAPTAADKRLINDTLDELMWHATLKPSTVGVPAFNAAADDAVPLNRAAPPADVLGAVADRPADVIELAVLSAQLRPDASDAQARRLLQLIHRAIPYPVLLAVHLPAGVRLSLAHKRASLGEAGKWVVADSAQTHTFDAAKATAAEAQFLASLALDALPRSALLNLAAMYQAYADLITALAVAQVTGQFNSGVDGHTAAAQRQALAKRQGVLQHIATARAGAAKARQLNQRVKLNLQVQRLQADLLALNQQLQSVPS